MNGNLKDSDLRFMSNPLAPDCWASFEEDNKQSVISEIITKTTLIKNEIGQRA